MDRLAALEAFVRVAESRSFSGAAEKLRLSKSVVSRHVGALEASLGVRLFQRTTRSLTLTEAGRGYLERTARILSDLDEADQAVSHLQAAPRGRLRIAAPMSFGFLHLAPAMGDFMALYPEIEVDMAMNDRFVDLVEEGFDVAVRIGAMEDSSLIARVLAPSRLAVCGSPDYLRRHGIPRTLADLRDHQCLSNSNIPQGREWRFETPEGQTVLAPVGGRISANNGDALRAFALQGLGLTYLPTFILGEDISAGRLVSVLDDHVMQGVTIKAVYPHARHLSPKVRAFVDFLAGRFGPNPPWDGSRTPVSARG